MKQEHWLTLEEAAALCRVSVRTIYQWIAQDAIPTCKTGRRTLLSGTAIRAALYRMPHRPHQIRNEVR